MIFILHYTQYFFDFLVYFCFLLIFSIYSNRFPEILVYFVPVRRLPLLWISGSSKVKLCPQEMDSLSRSTQKFRKLFTKILANLRNFYNVLYHKGAWQYSLAIYNKMDVLARITNNHWQLLFVTRIKSFGCFLLPLLWVSAFFPRLGLVRPGC